MPHGAGSVVSSLTSTRRTYGIPRLLLALEDGGQQTGDQRTPASAQTTAMATRTIAIRRRARRSSGLAHESPSRQGLAPWPTPRWQWTHCTASSRGRAASHDVVHEVPVAAQAVLLQDRGVPRRDHDRLVEVHEGEALRVAVAVVGLGDVLGDELVRQMAVDAPRRPRGAAPRLHDAYWSFMTWQFLHARGSVEK